MAAFRILYFTPATSHFSHAHPPFPFPFPNRCVTKPHPFLVKKDNPQIRALAQSQSQTIEPESAIAKEEILVSNTRLLLQNVPWTCTADHLRPLLEKHGSVLDIEVAFPPFSFLDYCKFRSCLP